MAITSRILYSIEAVNKTREEFGEVENGLERLMKARLAASKVVLEEQRTQRYLTQAYQAQHQQFMDTISVMQSVGSIGRSVLTMWQAYTISQMHVSESLDRVAESQIWVNTALEIYGEASVVYQAAAADLEKLEAAADKAKGNETMGLIGMGMTAIGVAAQVGTLAAKLGLIEQLALAGGIVIPFTIALGIREALKDTDYWEEGDQNLPPGPANAPSFRLDKWWTDVSDIVITQRSMDQIVVDKLVVVHFFNDGTAYLAVVNSVLHKKPKRIICFTETAAFLVQLQFI